MFSNKFAIDDALFTKFVYYYFKLVGLATMNYSKSIGKINELQTSSITYSKLGILYNLVLASLIGIFTPYRTMFSCMNKASLIFDCVIDEFSSAIRICTGIYILIVFCLRRNEPGQIGDKLKVKRSRFVNSLFRNSWNNSIFKTNSFFSSITDN